MRSLGLKTLNLLLSPKGENPYNEELMRRIDEHFLDTPFFGTRQMKLHLVNMDYKVGRRRVKRLMRKMGLVAVYQKPRTSNPHPEHKVYPYLLRGIKIDRPDQVWCADITYIYLCSGVFFIWLR